MYRFVRIKNPGPTFHADMTSGERETMNKHILIRKLYLIV